MFGARLVTLDITASVCMWVQYGVSGLYLKVIATFDCERKLSGPVSQMLCRDLYQQDWKAVLCLERGW